MGPTIARGPGPKWFRITLAVVACVYFATLLKHLPMKGVLRPLAFFTQCTRLFPEADPYGLEYRLEAWSCPLQAWVPIDPRPYFPIESDDKESRFQRLGYFYNRERTVMNALDDYILENHPHVDDGVQGPIGGIRFVRINWPIPPIGDPVARYAYRPLEPAPADVRKDLFWTRQSTRTARCEASR